jgi:hypothetical protein
LHQMQVPLVSNCVTINTSVLAITAHNHAPYQSTCSCAPAGNTEPVCPVCSPDSGTQRSPGWTDRAGLRGCSQLAPHLCNVHWANLTSCLQLLVTSTRHISVYN